MEYFRKIWENIKIQPDIWLFFLFLFTFTLSTRKVILHFPIQGTFNEYAGIYIYISDIFLVLTIVLWLFTILCDNFNNLSMSNLWITCRQHKLSPVSRRFLKSLYLSLPLLLVIWSFLSILWSGNQTIALFRSTKLLEFYVLYLYVTLRLVPRGTFIDKIKQCSTWNIVPLVIILISFIQSAIGIIQILIQRSIGLSFLGESLIAPNIPGVAKIVFHGERYIRAYGLFPHPNILGGYLLLSIILTVLCLQMLHAKIISPSPYQGEGGRRPDEVSNVPRGTILSKYSRSIQIILYVTLAIQFFALILSFSKSAILGLAIALLYIYVPRLPRGLFHVEQSLRGGTFFTGWNINRDKLFHACPVGPECSTWNILGPYGVE